MNRLFTNRQRQILAMLAAGKCSICGVELEHNFHADHVVPHSKNGPTTLQNGQALCASCNLKKGDR